MFKLLTSTSSSDKDNVLGNRPRLSRWLIADAPSGEAPPKDINKLLAAVLAPRPQPSVGPTPEEVAQKEEAYQALQCQCQEQAQLLETLRKQLAELSPFAAIGAAQLSPWHSYSPPTNGGSSFTTPAQPPSQVSEPETEPETYEALQQQSEAQAAEIAALREKIADFRRVAAIGEARVNKWRSRTFR